MPNLNYSDEELYKIMSGKKTGDPVYLAQSVMLLREHLRDCDETMEVMESTTKDFRQREETRFMKWYGKMEETPLEVKP